ncbi:MAG: nuclease [Frankiales bacterium]|nr:nuclease [Frankiales bacterium]
MSVDEWATPGVPFSRAGDRDEPVPAHDVAALVAALEAALAVDPAGLGPASAVLRAETLLAAQDRLALAGLRAVADVEARELWRERQAGSTRTWLRSLPCGDRGQLTASRVLREREVLSRAVEDGTVALRTAVHLARELDRVPAHVAPEQLEAVLVDGLGDLLRVWAGAACLDPTPEQEAEFERRRALLAEAVRSGLAGGWTGPDGQLEPAFVLAAQVLAPAEAEAGIAVLVDALQPEAVGDDAADQAYRERGLTLRKLKGSGWDLRAHLTDEVGQRAYEELHARARSGSVATSHEPPDAAGQEGAGREPSVADSDDTDATSTGTDRGTDRSDDDADADADDGTDATRFGTTGPGRPRDPFGTDLSDHAVQGTPVMTQDQRLHDAFAQLLLDLHAVRPGSRSTLATTTGHLTLTASVDAVSGRPGAPPGRLRTAGGDVPLTTSQLRDHACRSLLSTVLLDARGRPLGASGTHRHATQRERRVLRTVWGSTCAVNGCGLPSTVPHHVEPFWKSRQTRLADLVPICEHHHHDVHEGHAQLRLRDGRVLDELGWVAPAAAPVRRTG